MKCAVAHFQHFDSLEDIKSIFDSKLGVYRKLNSKLQLLSTMQINTDEIRSYVAQRLEAAFDRLISCVADMKEKWIEVNFTNIMNSLGVDLTQNLGLDRITSEVHQSFTKIQEYLNSEDSTTTAESLLKLKDPEEFEPQIQKILLDSNKRLKFQKIKVDLNFDPIQIERMIDIKGCGILLKNTDLHFVLSQLPQPVKKLNLLFSKKRDDGLSATDFHTKCDGIADTLVVCKGNGHIFGGYARPPWNSGGAYIRDPSGSSFLFTCRNQTKHPLTEYAKAIYGHGSMGPTFGSGHDLDIDRSGEGGYTAIGNSYSIPDRKKSKHYMAGTEGQAEVIYEDYEVYQVIFE